MEFDRGLTVLTGETGAGKTVLAHSLDLLTGGKAKKGIVRPGAEEAWVEGVFDLPEGWQEVPELALRLSVAERLVTHLFLARQTGEQYPTVCEFQTLAVIGPLQEKPGEAPVGRPAVSPVGPERKSFRIEIRCSPEVLYDYVRRLTLDSWLFILTDLTVTNERQTFPLRSQVAKSLAPAGSPGAVSAEKTSSKKKLLEILAGEEFVTAVICLDFVNWKPSAEAVPAAASSP